MITFRFYLVTLVALFLAIALGVVVGSSFLEPALVERLQDQVADVNNRLDEQRARIDEQIEQIAELETYVEEAAPFIVDGRLDDAQLLVVAQDGVDTETMEQFIARSRQAGAQTEGIVWLSEAWSNAPSQDGGALAEFAAANLLGGTTTDSVDENSNVRAEAWGSILDSFSAEPGSNVFAGSAGLQTLAGKELVRLQPIESSDPDGGPAADRSPSNFAIVLVTSNRVGDGSTVTDLARAQASRNIATLVAEIYEPEGDEPVARGSTLVGITDDAELVASVSTVDDLELVQGRVAAVLSVADLADGIVGHYGYGPGTNRPLPQYRLGAATESEATTETTPGE